jgi:two-component system, NarL family, response regulator
MEPCKKIHILIVDDHPVVRAGLASMLRAHPGLSVVGSACCGEEALQMAGQLAPDVLLVDLRMPGMSGIELIRALRERSASATPPRAIVLTSYETDEDIYRAVEAGAHGYLLKDASEYEMIEAIRSAYAGKRYFPPAIAARLTERMNRTSLTPREHQILQMLAKGLTNKEVGRVLGISENTARNHVNSIIGKLEVSDRTEAVATAIQQGLIPIAE